MMAISSGILRPCFAASLTAPIAIGSLKQNTHPERVYSSKVAAWLPLRAEWTRRRLWARKSHTYRLRFSRFAQALSCIPRASGCQGSSPAPEYERFFCNQHPRDAALPAFPLQNRRRQQNWERGQESSGLSIRRECFASQYGKKLQQWIGKMR